MSASFWGTNNESVALSEMWCDQEELRGLGKADYKAWRNFKTETIKGPLALVDVQTKPQHAPESRFQSRSQWRQNSGQVGALSRSSWKRVRGKWI